MWLGIVVGAVCAMQRLVMVWKPAVILPQWDVSTLAALSVMAMLLDGMTGGRTHPVQKRVFDAVLAAVIFAAYPVLSGTWETTAALWKLAAVGGAVYAVTEEMIAAMEDRMISGGRGNMAVAMNGLLLILASQAFDHMIF